MLKDLAAVPGQSVMVETDIAIIGAGTVGLLIAAELAKAGKRIVVIESGGKSADEDVHPLNQVELVGDPYLGATLGRARCLGGTSTRWGGAMLPFQACDWGDQSNTDWAVPKGFPHSELMADVPALEKLFGLPPGDYDEVSEAGSPFLGRHAKWPPFRLRNTATLFADIVTDAGHNIWLNATMVSFSRGANGLIEAAEARSINGSTLHVRASQWVFACGAIENTRVLLAIDRAADDQIFAPDAILGRWFHDHISAPVAMVTPTNPSAFNHIFGFGFEGSAMRNLRYEPAAIVRRESNLPAGFAHVSFATDMPSGFDALRDILRRVQAGRLPELANFGSLVAHFPWLCRAGWWRFAHYRVLFPPGATFRLNMVAEQRPVATNRISLSDQKRDLFGTPAARIDWAISPEDEMNLSSLAGAFMEHWKSSNLSSLGILTPMAVTESREIMLAEGGVYHPGGTTRIAESARDGIADSYGQCHQLPNVWPLSTALFGRGGGANPTMSLLLMGMRAARKLASAVA